MKLIRFLPFFVVPLVILFFTIWLSYAHGPYWIFQEDPEYSYLMNGLNVARFQCCVYHIDHPGTPVQILIGGIIKVAYQFRSGQDPLPIDVIKNPEEYLLIFHSVFVALNITALVAVGIFAYIRTQQTKQALLLQLAPLLSITTLVEGFVRVTPEPILFLSISLLEILLIEMLWNHNWHMTILTLRSELRTQSKKVGMQVNLPVIASLCGIISGVGFAAKLTFLPIIILFFFLIPKMSSKLAFLFWTIVAFLASTFLIWDQFAYVRGWMSALLTHTGSYGHGAEGYVDWDLFTKNLFRMLSVDPFFFIQTGFIGLYLVFFLLFARKTTTDRKFVRALLFIFCIDLLSIWMGAKLRTSSNRYILPALSLSGLTLAILSVSETLRGSTRLFQYLLGLWILANLIHVAWAATSYASLVKHLQVTELGVRTPGYALQFGNSWSGKRNGDIIEQFW